MAELSGHDPDPIEPSSEANTEPGPRDPVATGDIVIDAALGDLAALPADDLDGHIEAAESLQRTLQGRLANLGE